jgi:CopG-like RHH_1 or ribbon-helix-helix domain, RHH_5
MQKRVVVLLPADTYRRLAEEAQREERDPTQQARLIIRRALEHEQSPSPAVPA